MSSLVLKIIATILMTIEYSGVIIFDNNLVFRYFGRAAFPLFAFLLVEGYNHTKNDKKRLIRYALSLLILALLTEFLYDKLFFKETVYLGSQNPLFELILGLLCLFIYDKFSNSISKVFTVIIVIYLAFMSDFLFINNGTLGILLLFGYYIIINLNIKNKYKNLLYLLVDIIYIVLFYFTSGGNLLQIGVLLSLIPIALYNGEKGYKSKAIQYSFYLYYPILLLILLLFK